MKKKPEPVYMGQSVNKACCSGYKIVRAQITAQQPVWFG